MTADLSDRDLDVAVARAMGWKKPSELGRCDRCGFTLAESRDDGCVVGDCSMRYAYGEPKRADVVPSYSADPSTLDEKLAWLRAIGEIEVSITDSFVLVRFFPHRAADFRWYYRTFVSEDIHEATARLVVAVKEAMGDAT